MDKVNRRFHSPLHAVLFSLTGGTPRFGRRIAYGYGRHLGIALVLTFDQLLQCDPFQIVEDLLIQPHPQIMRDALLIFTKAIAFAASLGRIERLIHCHHDVCN